VATTPNIYQAKVSLSGTTGLVLDNIDTADPENPVAKEIKKITDKDEMTTEDRKRKDWLAYHGALYLDDQKQLVMPYRCIKRALRSGAYVVGSTQLSGKIDAGVSASTVEFPLDYVGPDVDKLYEDDRFKLRLMVNKNPSGKKAMVPSVRPILPEWGLAFTLTVFNDVIGWDKLVRAIQATGVSIGIGNARKLGYGRFTAEVTQL
jgi:hypothetical protein